MSLTFGSVCSGIEAASAAWLPLGWRPMWYAEVAPFPSAVLAHHHPEVRNYGDFTALLSQDHGRATPDVLVGGTPCQSFSVAGLRGGLSDPRGNLALAFVLLAGVLRPRWVVWENVPGVLSIDGGRAFGSILGGLAELGYGWAYRVMDAQYFGLAQRRKRVFVVASPGDWRRSAAVLFEPESLCRDHPPRREAGARVAGSVAARAGSSGPDDNAGQANHLVPSGYGDVAAFGGNNTRGPIDVATAVRAKGGSGHGDFESETFVTHSLRGEGHDASEDGTGRGVPLVPVAYMPSRTFGSDGGIDERFAERDVCDALHTKSGQGNKAPLIHNARAFNWQSGGDCRGLNLRDTTGALARQQTPATLERRGVRRLLPIEAERLQGFPDDFTRIPWRGRPAEECPDGPRYKALGNSMAVPVMAWLGRRIAKMDEVG